MPNTPPPAPPDTRRRPFFIAAGVVVGLGLALGAVTVTVVQRWQAASDARTGDTGAPGADADALGRVTLYYVAEDGLGLIEQEVDLPYDGDVLTRARAVVERQLDSAPSPLVSPFPAGTELRALYLADDGNAFVDLSVDVTTRHSGGSLDELFTVYALVNALTTNVPEIGAVQIMIGGSEVDTLAGHIDLRQPLEPSMKWVVDPDALVSDDADETDSPEPPAANS